MAAQHNEDATILQTFDWERVKCSRASSPILASCMPVDCHCNNELIQTHFDLDTF